MATTDTATIDALLIERAGYERRGLADRVAQVDAALERAGHVVPKPEPTRAPASSGKRTTKA